MNKELKNFVALQDIDIRIIELENSKEEYPMKVASLQGEMHVLKSPRNLMLRLLNAIPPKRESLTQRKFLKEARNGSIRLRQIKNMMLFMLKLKLTDSLSNRVTKNSLNTMKP